MKGRLHKIKIRLRLNATTRIVGNDKISYVKRYKKKVYDVIKPVL